MTVRTLALVATLASMAAGVARCSSDDTSANGGDASTNDGSVDLCDLNAYTGVGKPCAYTSTRVCFQQCEAGGCKCVAGSSGPVWSCVSDFSCAPETGPLDDVVVDTAPPLDAADASVDAAVDG